MMHLVFYDKNKHLTARIKLQIDMYIQHKIQDTGHIYNKVHRKENAEEKMNEHDYYYY